MSSSFTFGTLSVSIESFSTPAMPADERPATNADLATFPSPNLSSRDGLENDGPRQCSMPLLGVPLTGNLLFTTCWITGLGIAKAVYSYQGQSVISPTLDWVGGTVLTLISLWLGVIEDKRPDLCQWFFKVDLAPPILGFLCRRTVHHWFASIPPLLQSVTMMVDAGRFRKYESAQKGKDRFIEISGGILVCITLSLFFLYGLRVFWKRGYDRIARYASRTMMVTIAFEFMYTMACVYVFRNSKYTEYTGVKAMMTFRCLLWMIPLLPLYHSSGGHRPESHKPLTEMFFRLFFVGTLLMMSNGFVDSQFPMSDPDFRFPNPVALYSTLFNCGNLYLILRELPYHYNSISKNYSY